MGAITPKPYDPATTNPEYHLIGAVLLDTRGLAAARDECVPSDFEDNDLARVWRELRDRCHANIPIVSIIGILLGEDPYKSLAKLMTAVANCPDHRYAAFYARKIKARRQFAEMEAAEMAAKLEAMK